MSVDAMGSIATHLRAQLDASGHNATKIIGYEHNWVGGCLYDSGPYLISS
jgi:hypothetical protein